MVIPCVNNEKEIGRTIQKLIDSDYKGLKQIIVVDDGSTDNTFKVAKRFEKIDKRVKVVQTGKNTGRAAGGRNFGAKFITTELIGFTDDDSRPLKDAISNMIGYFNDKKVGGVTSRVLVYNRKKFLSRFQAIEYKVIAFTRKLFGFIDAIYVTNGPLSIYRKSIFDEVGGFSMTNWTEDIEITWHMVSKGYKIHMAIPAKVYTVVPTTFKGWFRQRLRWNVGGIQTVNSYKKHFFSIGMLGSFILPFFAISWVLAIFGFLVLVYRITRTIIIRYFSTKLSIQNQAAILSFNDINFHPSILIFFGVVILTFSILYNVFAMLHSREKEFKNEGVFSMIGYMTFYLTAYPAVLISSIYKFIRGMDKW
ncbi:MAG: glycosyltransferase [Candidatus Pacearchaeota archaeon]